MTLYTICDEPWEPSRSTGHGGGSSRGSHRLASALKCRYRHQMLVHLGYKRRVMETLPEIAPSVAGPAKRGTAGHAWLGKLYGGPDTRPWEEDEAMRALSIAYERRYAYEIANARVVMQENELYGSTAQLQEATGADLTGPGRVNGRVVAPTEAFTSRLDLMIEHNLTSAKAAGLWPGIWIQDFKIESPSTYTGKLWSWDEDGKYFLLWQALVNMLVARVMGFDVQGFAVRRVNALPPHDSETRIVPWPRELQDTEGAMLIRDAVACDNEIHEMTKSEIVAPRTGIPYGECARFGSAYGCPLQTVCSAQTRKDRVRKLKTLFTRGG